MKQLKRDTMIQKHKHSISAALARRLALGCLLLFLGFGGLMAQTDGQYVIKKGEHYLAHVYNETSHKWELQDATSFSPNCLWYSGRDFNIAGTEHNYYFYDGSNYRFLSAPLEANGALSLSSTVPETYLLNNSDEIYYFYDWDKDAYGPGVARGHKYPEATTPEECAACLDGDWSNEAQECWRVYWIELKNTGGDNYNWELSANSSYGITPNSGRNRSVTATVHPMEVTQVNAGGLTAITVPAEMAWGGSAQTLSATVSAYSYTYIPAYTTYVFEGRTHNYCNSDLGTSTPSSTTSTNNTVTEYHWAISGDAASYLSLNDASAASPTLTYSTQNIQGHKTATITLTVTYSDGATQELSQDVLVKTTCQNPAQASAPVVTLQDVTVSWYPTSTQYKVYWKKHSESSFQSEEVGDVTSYVFIGLAYNTQYDYKVSAYCGDAYLEDPTVYTFTTKTEPMLMVRGAVFGGGRMADVGGKTEVVIINCDSLGAVYGGNDIAGAVTGAAGSTIILGVNANDSYAHEYNDDHASTKVRIGDVYGGGNGYYTYDGHEPSVEIGTTVHTSQTDYRFTSSVTEVGGSTSYLSSGTIPTITKTSITVTNNYVKVDSIFGGAKNAFVTNNDASANGTSIEIKGGTIFAVFGGNNYGGTQTAGKHYIKVSGTSTNFIPNVQNTATTGYGHDFGIGYLFGGGNKVEGLTTDILITGGQCDTVFAGGNAATVATANVQVNCSFGAGSNNVFGDIYTNAISSYDGSSLSIKDNYAWNGTGVYNVRTLFGGNNQAHMNGLPTITLTSGSVGTVYGGGNAGDMKAAVSTGSNTIGSDFGFPVVNGENQTIKYSTHVVLDSPSMFVDYLYGGCQMSHVDYSTWVEINNGHVGYVFGGCNISGDVGSNYIYSYQDGMPGDQYQLTKGATYVKASGGTIYKNLFAGSNGYYHCNDGVYYIDGIINEGHYIGMEIPTHNETHVMVSGNTHVKGNMYAGGNLAPVGFIKETAHGNTYRQFVGFASVRMSGGTVDGDVYGGGNMASVYGSNEVRISGGTIGGALYGGNDQCGLVAQITNRVLPADFSVASDDRINLTSMGVHTYVGISGKPHINVVYGGGNGAYEYTAANYCNPNDQPVQSNTFVDINIDATGGETDGGRINTVYGGGNGVTVTGATTILVNVQNAGNNDYDHVGTIFGGNNLGNLAILPDLILLNGRVDTVYGGCNSGAMTGSFTVEGYPNVGSRVILRDSYTPVGSSTAMTLNGLVSGAVYGGCRMNDVTNNTLVLVESGNHPDVSIYGGSDISGTVYGTAQVVVTGGSISNAYGGGNGNYDYTSGVYQGLTPPHCVTSKVEMTGGHATHSLYAGSYAGTCGDTYIDMYNGTVDGDVFGGGYGATSSTTGNVSVNIGSTNSSHQPTVEGNVYGGSAFGNVNDASTDLTTVNILSGTINGDIYGGGLGDDTHEPAVNGVVHVNIGADNSGTGVGNASINGRVFGCNNANGSPKANVFVDIYSTAHTSGNAYPSGVTDIAALEANSPNQQYAISEVYGGGNLADYTPLGTNDKAQVHIHYCDENTVQTVYGGGNAANSTNTSVIVDGGRIQRVFGGGNGYSSTGNHDDPTAPNYNPGADITGTAYTLINAGLIDQVFGGSNQYGTIGNVDLNIVKSETCPELILETFGGGNEAVIVGDIETNLECSDDVVNVGNFYGGSNLADIEGNVTLNVYGGHYTNIFGGSKGQAGRPANIDGNVTLNLHGGTITNAFGGCNVAGNITGKITVNVIDTLSTTCPLVLTNVYGAGKDAFYRPNDTTMASPEVNVLNGTVLQNVFGGGLGDTATVTANPVVTIGDLTNTNHVAIVGSSPANSTPYGNVYGGGELAQVVGSTHVLVQQDNTFIHGTVYGGGKGSTSNANDGLVTVNTLVQLTGGEVQRSIYGGGELGSVGTFLEHYDNPTTYYNNTHEILHMAGEPKNRSKKGTGLTKVLISGGKVGPTDSHGLMPDPNNPASNDDFGYVFCASKGLNAEEEPANGVSPILLAVSDSSYLEISGTALITASVYGGSENGQVLGNTHVKIMGGQIGVGYDEVNQSWDNPYANSAWETAISKVKDGSFEDNDANGFHLCDAWPFGDEGHRYVYDYYARYELNGEYYYADENGNPYLDENGDPIVDDESHLISSNGGSYQARDGHSFFGHVFGGGSGYYPYAPGQWRRSAGRVCGDTYVEITGGHVLTNIYGGNEITDVFGHSKVVMTGGTLGVPRSKATIQGRPVNSNLFGAGMGDPRTLFNQMGNVGSSEVIVGDNAVVFGSVFGGGEDGHVLGNATTTITGSAVVGTTGTSDVDGNVFGGGRGYTGVALTAGVVCGNVTLDISDNAYVLGSAFGGGRLAAVGTHLAAEGSVNYGKLQTGDDHGNITVNVSGGTIGNLSKLDNRVYTIGDVYGGSKGTLLKDVAHNQRLGLAKNTTVNISQAAGKTTTVYGSVYGGGEIASVGSFEYATANQAASYSTTHPSEPMAEGDVYALVEGGLAKVNISGGTIGTNDFTTGSKTQFSIYRGNVFGSCLGKAGPHYSGYSFVDTTYVHITGGTVYGSVFGGGENGHVLHNTNVSIENGVVGIRIDTISNPVNNIIFLGNVYGGGRGIDEVTDNGKISATYSITAGKVSGNSNVTVSGGTVYRNVYGGGSFASVGDPDENPADGNFTSGLATVSVSGGTIGTDGGKNANTFDASGEQHRNNLKENGFVFGSGRGLSGAEGSVYDSLAYVNNSVVNITGTAYVTGSVFGGGENGHVKNHTLVNVNPGGSFISENISTGDFATYNYSSQNTEPYPVIGYPLCRDDLVENLAKPRIIYRGNVYGGGRGIDPKDELGNLSENAGVVYGNTEVRISGGTIRHDVYGGGSVASVGTLTYDHNHNDSVASIHPHTGNASVFISGGIIGIDTTLSITKVMDGTTLLHNLAGVNNGQVYGGGRGQSGTLFKNLAYVDSTHVEISGGVIYGAVFGGGCNGHVKRDTYVKMTAGTIGHTLSETEKSISITQPEPVYFGNVYGGGRGIDHTNLPSTISHTAGQVYGNTRVDISGGRVHNDVYGGGSLANVGVERYDAQGNVVGITSGGYAYVNITGNAIIGTDGRNAGFVYGSGRGMAGETWSDMAYVDMTFVTIGTENGSDNPQVRGSVFGGGSNGHVEEHTDVRIYTGTIGTPLTADEMVEADPTLGTERHRVYRGNVYGGGRGVERSTSGSSALSPTAGRVFGNTNVSVFGGTVYHNVYGGGSLASVGTFTIENNQHVFADTTGKATVNINGGTIGMSADVLNSLSLSTNYSGLNNGQVYGSGRGEAGAEYADFAFVKETEVNIGNASGNTQPVIFGAVFGGGANGHVKAHTQVNVSGGTIGIDDIDQGTFNVYRGNVYGGGRGIDIDTVSTTSVVSPTAGKVYGNTEVNVSGGTIYHNVFGGGSLASVGTTSTSGGTTTFTDGTGTTTVNISGGQIGLNSTINENNGHVFGSGRGYPNPDFVDLTYAKETYVNIYEGATIKGSVFGSGDNAQVYTDTHVAMSGGVIGTTGGGVDGNVFGSGRGSETYTVSGNTLLNQVSGLVHGNTNVTVSGGNVKNNVYGGGLMASVGTASTSTGTAYVNVNGTAHVGSTSRATGDIIGGNVFGGSRGDPTQTGFATVRHTEVTIEDIDVQILNNVYGGGEVGAVLGTTQVTSSDATLNNIYGAGKGHESLTSTANADVAVSTSVTFNSGVVNNIYGGGEMGTIHYVDDSELSSANLQPYTDLASTVTVIGGTITHDVYGGGDEGTTRGEVVTNLNGGTVQNELFGGAKGTRGSVYVAGMKTVNVRGGTVYNHVYGGSRNANDGLRITGNPNNANTYTAFVNVSGGLLRGDVYGAGYFGEMYGSSDVNIGVDAINNANDKNTRKGTHTPAYLHIIKNVYAGSNWGVYDPAVPFANSTTTGHSNVYVDGNGYDTQTLTPPANIYTCTYMELGGSVYGSGTSGDAGTLGRKIQVANYGHPIVTKQELSCLDGSNSQEFKVLNSSTRSMQSIQRCDTIILDNITIKFTGQGDISQNYNTVEYSFMYVDEALYVRNGSNIITDVQIDEIHSLHSEYRPETVGGQPNGIYLPHPTTYWIGIGDTDYKFYYINGNTATALDSIMTNTIRFNGGYSLFVRYSKTYDNGQLSPVSPEPELFGELRGFFRIVTEDNNETFAHARPKITEKSDSNANLSDGGFMSYYDECHNNFTEIGLSNPGNSYTRGQQFPYLNVLQNRSDRPDYRYWRMRTSNTGNHMVSPMAFFLFSNPNSTEDFITIERTITLPTLECGGNSYFVLSDVDYGDHVHLVNSAIDKPNTTDKYWMVQHETATTYQPQTFGHDGPASSATGYYNQFVNDTATMHQHPNTHFGLVIEPGGALTLNSVSSNHEYLLSMTTREYLSEASGTSNPAKFDYPADPNGQMAKVTIRLTYYKEMSMSMALTPVTIELKSYCVPDPTDPGNIVLQDVISIPIYITTQTALGQNMTTSSYAMFGDIATDKNPEIYNVKATLPPFIPLGVDVPFYVYGLEYDHNNGSGSTTEPTFSSQSSTFPENDFTYAMVFKRGFNSDNKSGWREAIDAATPNYYHDANGNLTEPILLGSTDGRTPSSIDFTLYYNSCDPTPENTRYEPNIDIGTLKYHICYPKAAEDINLTPNPNDATNWAKFDHFDINIILHKKEHSLGFYLDGILGNNLNTGAYADFGVKTLQSVLDHDWTPGDIIWVVRPIHNISTVTWTNNNGAPIVLSRYPGSFVDPVHHSVDDPTYGNDNFTSVYTSNATLKTPVANTGVYESATGYVNDTAIFANIKGNKSHLVLNNVILDGYNDETNPQIRPLLAVSEGGTITLMNNTEIRNSNNHQDDAPGSAVFVGEGGDLVLLDGVNIHHNVITNTTHPSNGAAVYLEDGGTMTVGGLVTIKDNKVNNTINNVYLDVQDQSTVKDAVIHIGQEGLDFDSEIGVTKTEFYESGDLKDLTPIATSIYAENIHNAYRHDIFKDDTRKAYTHFFIENVLYFGKTWAHFQTVNPDNPSQPDAFDPTNINTKEKLGWFLSYVNGLNGASVHEDADAILTDDINMGEHYWKPLAIIEEYGSEHGYTGTFDGQGHTIDGLVIRREGFTNIGFFDNVSSDGTKNGVVKNLVIGSKDCAIYPWNPDTDGQQYAGGIAGSVMDGGLITSCESYPVLSAEDATTATYMGGIAGHIEAGGVVHSTIAMPTLTGYSMGGLVGKLEAGGDLYNSYANIQSINILGNYAGGLAGTNLGTIENCYAHLNSAEPDAAMMSHFGWFAGTNNGTIRYCYGPEGKTRYLATTTNAPIGHGNYGAVEPDIKALGYLYDDNAVTLASGQTNPHYSETLIYTDDAGDLTGHITRWPGLLSTLNHWVANNRDETDDMKHYTPWFRPLNAIINGDLPVLGFEDFNSVATYNDNGIVLHYADIDAQLTTLNAATDDTKADRESSMLVYGVAKGVTHAPAKIGTDNHPKVKTTVAEDAVLLLDDSAPDFEATVGVTFDNSWKKAHDYFANTLYYDWHLMSTPLSNAPMGTTYDMTANMYYQSRVNLTSMTNGYFPNDLPIMAEWGSNDVSWDLYSYDERDYHWINFKRSTGNHWHLDTLYVGSVAYPNPIIHSIREGGDGVFDPNLNDPYDNETTYIPGKGYMMGISQDSYMNNTGILNKGTITIPITSDAPENVSGKPTYDRGSNLVGNPYQAYLDLDAVEDGNKFLEGYYLYIAEADADVACQGLYVPYTSGQSPNVATPSRYIHPHQGFFVVLPHDEYTAGNDEMIFTTTMAGENKDNGSHFRGENSDRIAYPLVNLYVSDTMGNADIAIVEFNRPEVGGVHKINNLRNADFNLYTHFENEDWGLLFTPRKTARVPVFFKTPNDGTYTLTWRTHNGTFSTMRLIDNLTGVNYDMLTNDHYTFEASATDYAARFYIVFNVTDVNEFEEEQEIFAYFNGEGWVVEGEGQLELVDMLGQVLYTNHLSGAPTIVHFGDIAVGTYMLRLVNSHDVLKAQKIVIY